MTPLSQASSTLEPTFLSSAPSAHAAGAAPPAGTAPAWREDWVFLAAVNFYERHGHLMIPSGKDVVAKELLPLRKSLQILRKAYYADQLTTHGYMLRRQLSQEEMHKWESAFPKTELWHANREQEYYLPGSCLLGSRYEWPREPYLSKPYACYLCGQDFDLEY